MPHLLATTLLPAGATKAVAGAGVNASMLGTKKVAGGLQVTYGGKPLYWFSKDKSPGKVTGNKVKDQWGVWSIVVTVKPKAWWWFDHDHGTERRRYRVLIHRSGRS